MAAPCIEEQVDSPPAPRRRRSLRDWLDDRTGYRRGLKVLFGRELPDGPKWGYSIASCLLWLMVVQVATGFLLMTTYSPSLTTAWASVHFIEQDAAGSFLRGVHHYAAQAMIVLFLVHLVRVLLSAAFRAPRELVWITGLLLIPLVLVWAITGNPLPGSQRGMSQIDVEGNIVGTTPLIGPILQRVLIGGNHVGNLTLTHLYFLHVALLPLIAALLLGVHIWQIYRHGLSGGRKVGTDCGLRIADWKKSRCRRSEVRGRRTEVKGRIHSVQIRNPQSAIPNQLRTTHHSPLTTHHTQLTTLNPQLSTSPTGRINPCGT